MSSEYCTHASVGTTLPAAESKNRSPRLPAKTETLRCSLGCCNMLVHLGCLSVFARVFDRRKMPAHVCLEFAELVGLMPATCRIPKPSPSLAVLVFRPCQYGCWCGARMVRRRPAMPHAAFMPTCLILLTRFLLLVCWPMRPT